MVTFLDIPTLLITTAVACLCIAVSLFLIWRSARGDVHILSWSLCYGLGSATMALVSMRESLPDILAAAAPGMALLGCFGALWLGYRQFAGRVGRFDRLWAGAGALTWLAYTQTGSAFADIDVRLLVNEVIELAYLLSIVHGLAGHFRREPLPAVGLTVVLVAVHAVKLVLGAAIAVVNVLGSDTVVMANNHFFGLGLIESSVFAVFLGLLQLVLIGQRAQQRLRIAAETDSLTGLANRGHFLAQILPRLVGAVDRGALIVFDIDHFKRVNDGWGHPVGDRALAGFATELARNAPAGGIAARIGGEEFALFLPDAAVDAAAAIAERIRRRIRDLCIPTAVGTLRLTVSCGVAGVHETGADYPALHGAADAALYAAKRGGRDRVEVHGRPASEHRACRHVPPLPKAAGGP